MVKPKKNRADIVYQTDLTKKEWDAICAAILLVKQHHGSNAQMYDPAKMARSMRLLQKLGNAPTQRYVLFVKLFQDKGEKELFIAVGGVINGILRYRKLPFGLRCAHVHHGAGSTYDAEIFMVRTDPK